jgi:hypothetical protein
MVLMQVYASIRFNGSITDLPIVLMVMIAQ